jgi:hypothetical protein
LMRNDTNSAMAESMAKYLLASFTCTGTHGKPSERGRRRDVRDFAWTMRQLVAEGEGGGVTARSARA